jgi:hypothetical protein
MYEKRRCLKTILFNFALGVPLKKFKKTRRDWN